MTESTSSNSWTVVVGNPHLNQSLKKGAPDLDFQTWDSVEI
jgi:hypothetical protein